jgi:hypothetical protein
VELTIVFLLEYWIVYANLLWLHFSTEFHILFFLLPFGVCVVCVCVVLCVCVVCVWLCVCGICVGVCVCVCVVCVCGVCVCVVCGVGVVGWTL